MNLSKLNQLFLSIIFLVVILAVITWILQQFHANTIVDQSTTRALREKFYWECFAREYQQDNNGGTEKSERVSTFCSVEADKYADALQ